MSFEIAVHTTARLEINFTNFLSHQCRCGETPLVGSNRSPPIKLKTIGTCLRLAINIAGIPEGITNCALMTSISASFAIFLPCHQALGIYVAMDSSDATARLFRPQTGTRCTCTPRTICVLLSALVERSRNRLLGRLVITCTVWCLANSSAINFVAIPPPPPKGGYSKLKINIFIVH